MRFPGVPKKSSQKTIRFDEETLRQMEVLCAKTELELPKLIRSLVSAAHRYYEAHGHIYLPLEVRPLHGVGVPSTLPAEIEPVSAGTGRRPSQVEELSRFARKDHAAATQSTSAQLAELTPKTKQRKKLT
jgi:hypothetical protein